MPKSRKQSRSKRRSTRRMRGGVEPRTNLDQSIYLTSLKIVKQLLKTLSYYLDCSRNNEIVIDFRNLPVIKDPNYINGIEKIKSRLTLSKKTGVTLKKGLTQLSNLTAREVLKIANSAEKQGITINRNSKVGKALGKVGQAFSFAGRTTGNLARRFGIQKGTAPREYVFVILENLKQGRFEITNLINYYRTMGKNDQVDLLYSIKSCDFAQQVILRLLELYQDVMPPEGVQISSSIFSKALKRKEELNKFYKDVLPYYNGQSNIADAVIKHYSDKYKLSDENVVSLKKEVEENNTIDREKKEVEENNTIDSEKKKKEENNTIDSEKKKKEAVLINKMIARRKNLNERERQAKERERQAAVMQSVPSSGAQLYNTAQMFQALPGAVEGLKSGASVFL